MQVLQKFLTLGVTWHGDISDLDSKQHKNPSAATIFDKRPIKQLLRHASNRLNVKYPEKGIVLTPSLLTDNDYCESHARDAIRCLVSAGIIRRVPEPRMKTGFQSTARTFFNPELIRLALEYGENCQELRDLGKREKYALPARIELSIPLIWPQNPGVPMAKPILAPLPRQQHPRIGNSGRNAGPQAESSLKNLASAIPPNQPSTPSAQALERVSGCQPPNIGSLSLQNLEGTTKHAPPAQSPGNVGVLDPLPRSHVSLDCANQLPSTHPTSVGGGVSVEHSHSANGNLDSNDAYNLFFAGHFYQHFENHGACLFFKWLNLNNVKKVFINGQPRRKDGNRGAPVGMYFGYRYSVSVNEAVFELENFMVTLLHAKKKKIDLITWADDGHTEASKVLLIDDLDGNGLIKLKATWDGPGCILETSPGNFQAILIANGSLTRVQRVAAQRTLIQHLGGDPAANSAAQPHRFPGSPNFKFETPFFCRLAEFFDGAGSGLPGIIVAAAQVSVPQRQARSTVKHVSGDNSSQAFGWTISALRRGLSEQEILEEIRRRYLSHHDWDEWPRMTVFHAREVIAGTYQAGSGTWAAQKRRNLVEPVLGPAATVRPKPLKKFCGPDS